jgi:hypothetical protein
MNGDAVLGIGPIRKTGPPGKLFGFEAEDELRTFFLAPGIIHGEEAGENDCQTKRDIHWSIPVGFIARRSPEGLGPW